MAACTFDYIAFENNTFDVCVPDHAPGGYSPYLTKQIEEDERLEKRRRREEEEWIILSSPIL